MSNRPFLTRARARGSPFICIARSQEEGKPHKPHKHLFVEMEEHDEEEVHRRSRDGDDTPGLNDSSHRWNFGLEEDYDEAAHKWSMPHLPKLSARALTALPVHLQHGEDGAPYISATLDFSLDPDGGRTNVGMRRLMLRGRRNAA